jgi:uncharacterized protein (DUF433 family)
VDVVDGIRGWEIFASPVTDEIAGTVRWVQSEWMAKEYIEERNGGYYVAGTRISLDSIIHAFRRGESPETICQNFELLRLEEVYGSIANYLERQAHFDAYLVRQDEKWAEGRRAGEPLPTDLRERLLRAREELLAVRQS